MQLYPHNRKAYEAVMQAFDSGQKRAAVVHATGTGKSYIIASVVQHHRRTIVLAPREFILNEVRNVCEQMFPLSDGCHHVTFATYSSMLFMDGIQSDYDLIVLDEFHHTGAPQWGAKVLDMLSANPDAHVLGTSATPMRHSDRNRNMVDELFHGTMVSHIPLEEAIGTILPVPVYVRSIWDFDRTEQIIVESLLAARRTNEWKHDKVELVRRQCLDWKRSKGVPQILQKYITADMRHVIIFTPSIREGRRIRSMIATWMHAAGFSDMGFFEINSKVPGVGKVLDEYRQDDGHTMRIAIAINMLNEGVHIPGVDCVIMLRNTRSQTVIEQQLGRVLTVSSQKRPLVLDFVNNISLVYSHRRVRNRHSDTEMFDELTPLFDRESAFRYETPKLPFKVVDECTELDRLIKSISYNMDGYTIDELKEIALKYRTRTEWKYSVDKKAYKCAHRMGVMEEVSAHMGPVRKSGLTYEECVAEARKYKSREAFSKGSPSHFERMRRMKWMTDDILPRLRRSYTLEECMEMCREYGSAIELRHGNRRLYRYISSHGWMKECFSDTRIAKYTKEMARDIAARFTRRIDFKKSNKTLYALCCKNGWLDDVCSHMPNSSARIDVTYEQFLAAVAQCSTRNELWEKFSLEAKYATKNGWMTPDILPSKRARETRTNQQIVDDCLRYKTVGELYSADKRTYNSARRRNLLVVAFPDYQKKPQVMTLDIVLQRAAKAGTYEKFKKTEPTTYRIVVRRGWLPQVTSFFESIGT